MYLQRVARQIHRASVDTANHQTVYTLSPQVRREKNIAAGGGGITRTPIAVRAHRPKALFLGARACTEEEGPWDDAPSPV